MSGRRRDNLVQGPTRDVATSRGNGQGGGDDGAQFGWHVASSHEKAMGPPARFARSLPSRRCGVRPVVSASRATEPLCTARVRSCVGLLGEHLDSRLLAAVLGRAVEECNAAQPTLCDALVLPTNHETTATTSRVISGDDGASRARRPLPATRASARRANLEVAGGQLRQRPKILWRPRWLLRLLAPALAGAAAAATELLLAHLHEAAHEGRDVACRAPSEGQRGAAGACTRGRRARARCCSVRASRGVPKLNLPCIFVSYFMPASGTFCPSFFDSSGNMRSRVGAFVTCATERAEKTTRRGTAGCLGESASEATERRRGAATRAHLEAPRDALVVRLGHAEANLALELERHRAQHRRDGRLVREEEAECLGVARHHGLLHEACEAAVAARARHGVSRRRPPRAFRPDVDAAYGRCSRR